MEGNLMNKKALILILAATLVAPGCGSAGGRKSTCPVPDGVKCMGLAEVYERTETSADVRPAAEPQRARRATPAPRPNPGVYAGQTRPTGKVAYRPITHAAAVIEGDTLAVVQPVSLVLPATTTTGVSHDAVVTASVIQTAAKPVLAEPRVMRILVNAWEDEKGSLHMPGTIFTEVEHSRWSVGTPTATPAASFRLLEGLGDKAAKDSQASASSASAVSNQPGS